MIEKVLLMSHFVYQLIYNCALIVGLWLPFILGVNLDGIVVAESASTLDQYLRRS